jgi:hypothetical protein
VGKPVDSASPPQGAVFLSYARRWGNTPKPLQWLETSLRKRDPGAEVPGLSRPAIVNDDALLP